MGSGCGESFHASFHNHAYNFIRFIAGPYHRYLSEGSITDPHFSTVQYHMITGIFNIGEHAARVRSMIGFGKAKTAQPFTTSQFGQVFHFLLFAAIRIDRKHDQGALYRSRRTHPTVSPLQFLHHQSIGNIIQSAAAVLHRNGWAKTAQFTQLFYDMLRKLRFLGIVFNNGRNFFFHIRTNRIADHQVFLAQQFINGEIIRAFE